MGSPSTETYYRVRRGGYRLPVGTLLTTQEFELIKNRNHLLASGYFVAVRLPAGSKEKTR